MTTLAKINGIKTKICKHQETEKNRAASKGLLQSQGIFLHQMLSTASSTEEELVLYPKLKEQQLQFHCRAGGNSLVARTAAKPDHQRILYLHVAEPSVPATPALSLIQFLLEVQVSKHQHKEIKTLHYIDRAEAKCVLMILTH